MMGMGAAEMPDLKGAGPEEQVTAILHCGDTYDVTNGNGVAALEAKRAADAGATHVLADSGEPVVADR
jgi:hypothetical protein